MPRHQSPTIRLMRDPSYAPCCYIIARAPFNTRDDANTVLVQTDWEYPSVANTFGWTGDPYELDMDDAITLAAEWLSENIGAEAEDPGYFSD